MWPSSSPSRTRPGSVPCWPSPAFPEAVTPRCLAPIASRGGYDPGWAASAAGCCPLWGRCYRSWWPACRPRAICGRRRRSAVRRTRLLTPAHSGRCCTSSPATTGTGTATSASPSPNTRLWTWRRGAARGPSGRGAPTRLALAEHAALDVAAVRCPVTFVAGRYDSLVDVRDVRQAARAVPGARLREVPATHFVPLQFPGVMVEELARLLAADR